MAKTRNDLYTQSNSTFQDTPAGNITPDNHRQFNDDVVDSCANLIDENTFTADNTFDGTDTTINSNLYCNGFAQFTGSLAAFNTQIKQNIVVAPIASASSIDLSSVDGNFITITGTTSITEFIGNTGSIFYAKFDDTCSVNATGQTIPYLLNPNDVLVFLFTASNAIRVLAVRRSGGQEYFVLADYSAYNDIRVNSLFQPGAEYILNGYYENPTGFIWDIKLRAITNSTLESVAYIRRNGEWIPVVILDVDLSPGNLIIREATSSHDTLILTEYLSNSLQPQWRSGGSIIVSCDADNITLNQGLFRGVICEVGNAAQSINILNIYDQSAAFFGRILTSPTYGGQRFYSHHGFGNSQWGNNATYELALNAALIQLDNLNFGSQIYNLFILQSTYFVVNNICTINAAVSFEGKLDAGTSGHEGFFYFPIPFAAINNQSSSGHGALRFDTINNHANISALVEYYNADYCRVRYKYSTAVSAATELSLNFSYSYLIAS